MDFKKEVEVNKIILNCIFCYLPFLSKRVIGMGVHEISHER